MAKKTPAQVVTYIKLPAYEVNYAIREHGNPMVFGKWTPYYQIMKDNLVYNPKNKFKFTEMSFTSRAYKAATYALGKQLDLWGRDSPAIPSPDVIGQLVAVVVPPEKIGVDGQGHRYCLPITDEFQFNKEGAEDFREHLQAEFWTELGMWINHGKNELAKSKSGVTRTPSTKDMVLRFMDHYAIPVEHFENIYRNLNRNLQHRK